MRRENSIWLTRAQLGAALVLVAAVCTASFFVGLIAGEGEAMVAVSPEPLAKESTALLGPELERDTLTELLARVEVIPSAQAAALEFPKQLVTLEVDVSPPDEADEPASEPAQVLPEPKGRPLAPLDQVQQAASAGWAIEISSHSDPHEAAEVISRLAEDGFDAQAIAVLYGGQTRHRVRVGPIASQDSAEELKREVAASLGRPVELVEVR
ncbi:MAG: cell division protein FtsN [Cognaticolwellia sp.]|jgi:cell division protein FtsN